MHDEHADSLNRRRFLAASAGTALALPLIDTAHAAADAPVSHQATGVKVGEITPTSAIVWTRLTAASRRNNQGVSFSKRKKDEPRPKADMPAAEIEGACPGMAGRVRVRACTSPSCLTGSRSAWSSTALTPGARSSFWANSRPQSRKA